MEVGKIQHKGQTRSLEKPGKTMTQPAPLKPVPVGKEQPEQLVQEQEE
jgi:hypothetical protein